MLPYKRRTSKPFKNNNDCFGVEFQYFVFANMFKLLWKASENINNTTFLTRFSPISFVTISKKIYKCKNSKCKKMVLIYLQKLDYINNRPFTLCVNKKYLVPLSTKFFKRNLVTLKEQKSFYYFGKHPFFALLIT